MHELGRRRLPVIRASIVAPPPVWLMIGVMALGAALLWLLIDRAFGGPFDASTGIPWWSVAIAFALAEAWVVQVHFAHRAHALSLSEFPLVFALLFVSPLGLLAGHVGAVAVAIAIFRRQRGAKLCFNVAQYALSAGVALVTFRTLAGEVESGPLQWGCMMLAVAAANTVGSFLVVIVIKLAGGAFELGGALRNLAFGLTGALAAASFALAAAELVRVRPLALVLLAVPTIAAAGALRGYVAQRKEREKVEFLYASMRDAQGAPEFGLAIGHLLLQARELFRAEYAEAVLLPGDGGSSDDGALRSTSGRAGELLMRPSELTDADRALLDAARTTVVLLPRGARSPATASILDDRDIPDALVGVLRTERRTLGWFVVGDRSNGVGTFDTADARLFETFVSHAGVLLENGRLEQSLAHVTELKEQLHHQAFHDALTGLPNRVLFAEQVAAALARRVDTDDLAVLFLDLDDFKSVNDTWGHAAGDELLVHAAERLRGAIRPSDLPCRLGGDEFAVLLSGADEHAAGVVAERIAAAFTQPFVVVGRSVAVRPSIGIAVADPGLSTEDLLAHADIAMYTAKADPQRRNASYRPELHDAWRRRRELGFDLDEALEADHIDVYFQPAISLRDGRIRAVEALVRWHHPEQGVILPGDFLPFADARQLTLIGQVVLTKACRRAKRWQPLAPGGSLGVWVNLSAEELASTDLVPRLRAILEESGLEPSLLTLEVTESSVVHDEIAAVRLMHELRGLGVGLSIDDFGTGYSSLARLGEFPLDMLKIPKPFVDRLVGDAPDANLVDAILRLADSLGLVAVAEGVERAVQAERLTALGAELAQGYLYSPPLETDALCRLLRAGAALPRAA